MSLEINTYDGLVAAIADFLNKKNLSAQIPLFIRLAERVIFRELRCPANEKVGLYQGVLGVVDYPNDLLEAKLVSYNNIPLERKTDAQMKEMLERGEKGQPLYFGRKLAKLYVYPIPDVEGDLELEYYADYSGNYDSAIFGVAGDLYLFGALAEAYTYLKKPDEAQFWNSRLMSAMNDLNSHAIEADLAGSSLTVESAY